MGAGEKAMRCGKVGDELLELSSLICAAEMFGTSCRSYWWTKIKIWKHHYLQARQLRVVRRLGRYDDLEVLAGAHGLLSSIDGSGGRSHNDLIAEFIQVMAYSSLADTAQHLDSCGWWLRHRP
nr:uncharacterized protein LOC127345984 [Lolium perenne]